MRTSQEILLDFLQSLPKREFELNDEAAVLLTERMRQVFLDYGSETPDNIEALSNVKIGIGPDVMGYKTDVDFVLMKSEQSLSELIYHLEDMAIPAEVKEIFPELQQQDWNSAFRVIILILSSFRT